MKVVFACVHGAGRSQMAAAFFSQLANPTMAMAVAAGTEPASQVHPEVVAVMNECGVDLSQVQPQILDDEVASGASMVITMGCGEKCPTVPGARRADWELLDPQGRAPREVRMIRDDIRRRVSELLQREGWGRSTSN